VLIHIGYPKTGSTWIQRRVIDNDDCAVGSVAPWTAVRTTIIEPLPLWYEGEPVRRMLADGIARCGADGVAPVLSHELLCGQPVSGGFSATFVADRLHALAPEATVLIVVREQHAMLLSLYGEYVRNNGAGSLSTYLDPPSRDRFPVFDLRYLEFDRLAFRYQELFGADRVHVLLFEDLAADPLRFANVVLTLAGAPLIDDLDESPERGGLGGVGLSLRGRANAIVGRDRNNRVARLHLPGVAKAIESIDARAPDALQARVNERHQRLIADRVGDRYRASNQRLAERFALDLATKGYQT